MAFHAKPMTRSVVALVALATVMGSASAQFRPETQTHLDAASRNTLGDASLMSHYRRWFCGLTDDPSIVPLARSWVSVPIPLTQVTDDAWYIGSKYVGTYILKSDTGFALIDTLNNANDADRLIIPSLKTLGMNASLPLDGVYITHGHGDHDGGALTLRNTLNPRIYMGSADAAGKAYAPLTIDSSNLNPQPITIGGRTITLLPTPGHTPGTTAGIVPVRDNGRDVNMLVIGGSNMPANIATTKNYLNSVERMYALAKSMHAEGSMHPHQFYTEMEQVLDEGRATPSQVVVGSDKLLRGLAVYRECAAAFGTNVDATATIPVWRATRTHFVPGSPTTSQFAARVFNGWGPVVNQAVSFSVQGLGAACTARTNADGVASCSPSVGPIPSNAVVTASFAGSVNTGSQDLASEASAKVNDLPALQAVVVPAVLNLRTTAGLVTAVLSAPQGYDLRSWRVSNVRALGGAKAVSTAFSADGSSIIATFNRADFKALADGSPVMVTITGSFVNGGSQDEFVATTAVRVVK